MSLAISNLGSLRIEEIEFSPVDDPWKDGTVWRIPKRFIDSFQIS
jgi:hypothetical protein